MRGQGRANLERKIIISCIYIQESLNLGEGVDHSYLSFVMRIISPNILPGNRHLDIVRH